MQKLSEGSWNPFAPSAPVATDVELGKELVGSGLTGLGLGAGAVALYHLLHKMKREKSQQKVAPAALTSISSGAPLIDSSDEQKLASNLGNAATGGLLGVLGGGAYGALTAEPTAKNENRLMAKLRGALRGAAVAGAAGAGAGAAFDPLMGAIGRLESTDYIPGWGVGLPGGPARASKNPAHEAWRTVFNLGALGGGVLGGRALVNNFVAKEKEEENESAVEAARREYFAALSGKDEKAAEALDRCFETLEKHSVDEGATWTGLGKLYTGSLLALLGGAGIGGTYMYNRTKRLSDAENLRRALESRARMRGNAAQWVDPDELAAVKQMALSAEESKPRRLTGPAARG